jgi:hypothetical protein
MDHIQEHRARFTFPGGVIIFFGYNTVAFRRHLCFI